MNRYTNFLDSNVCVDVNKYFALQEKDPCLNRSLSDTAQSNNELYLDCLKKIEKRNVLVEKTNGISTSTILSDSQPIQNTELADFNERLKTIFESSTTDEKMNSVIEIFLEMKNKKKYPDVNTCIIIMRELVKENNEQEIDELLVSFKKLKIRLNVKFYNILFEFFAKRGNEKKINELLTEMKKEKIYKDKTTYDILIEFYNETLNIENTEKLVNGVMYDYLNKSLNSDDVINIYLFTNFDKAEIFLDVLEEKGLKFDPEIYKKFVVKYLNRKDSTKIEKTMKKMSSKGIDFDDIYNLFFDFFIENKNLDLAEQTYKTMKEKNIPLNSKICADYIHLLCNNLKRDEAVEVFNSCFYGECFKNENQINLSNLSTICACIAFCEFIKKWKGEAFIILTGIDSTNPDPYWMRKWIENLINRKFQNLNCSSEESFPSCLIVSLEKANSIIEFNQPII